MGRKSRNKGAAFECLVKNLILAAFPDAKVFRTLQADRAHQSDVHVAEGPGLLPRLWIECHHGPTAIAAKLQQAVQDSMAAGRADSIPVVVWRRTGARDVNVTLHLRNLVRLHAGPEWLESRGVPIRGALDGELVTTSTAAFLRLIEVGT